MRGQGRQVTPIEILPDDVLLAIFDFCAVGDGNSLEKRTIEAWQLLVHVCRRWRCVVFGSPRRLNLRLVCTSRTPARETLDAWPALPLIVQGSISSTSVDNIVVALGHSDRICQIDFGLIRSLEWDKVLAAMQVPFPVLTHLELLCVGETAPIPNTFLGGSAPRLQSLTLFAVPFPGLLNLLRSATHLVLLNLHNIPYSAYISPEAMATCLSMLTSLDALFLSLDFLYSRSRRSPPPMTRSILPNLNRVSFKGGSAYLDDLVAMVDAPRLDFLSITFPTQRNFDTPHLVQFISRTPRFEKPNEARVSLDLGSGDIDTEIQLLWPSDEHGRLRVNVSCERSLSLVPSIAQVCGVCLPRLSMVEILRLEIETWNPYSQIELDDYVGDDEWLDLLRSFPAVKSLYIPEELQSNLASALQELVGGGTMEVLPSLQNIFLEKFERSRSVQEDIEQFLAARQFSGHPIAVLPL